MQPPVPEHPAAVLGTQIRAPLSPRASNTPGAGRAGSPLLSLPAPRWEQKDSIAAFCRPPEEHLARSRRPQLPPHPSCPRLCLGKPPVLIEMLTPLPRSPRRLAAALTDGQGAGLPALSSSPGLGGEHGRSTSSSSVFAGRGLTSRGRHPKCSELPVLSAAPLLPCASSASLGGNSLFIAGLAAGSTLPQPTALPP